MVRLKIVKPHKKYNVGQTVEVTRNEAHGLLDGGYATYTKDVTMTEYPKSKRRRNGDIT